MKNSKRFLAMMTAGFLAITPMAATAMTAYAVTHTLTVTDTDTVAHTYKAYPIITGTLATDGQTLTAMSWDSGVNRTTLATALTAFDTAHSPGYFSGFTTSTTPAEFATMLGSVPATLYEDLAKVFNTSGVITGSGTELTENSGGTAYEASGLTDGWYLIKDETGSISGSTSARSANILEVKGTTAINPKYSLPTLDKVIVDSGDKEVNSASIGDTVTYNIKTKVPDMTGYNKYFFVVDDTLSKGLTYNGDLSITYGSGTALTLDTDGAETTNTGDYYVTASEYNSTTGTTIKVVFENFYNKFKNVAAGTDIIISYTATLNNNAVINGEGNPNTAQLTYSNDPNATYTPDASTPDEPGSGAPTGQTPSDTVKTYSTSIVIDKYELGTYTKKLSGVKFRISGTGLKSVQNDSGLYVKDASASPAYYLLNDGTYTSEEPTGDSTHDAVYASTTEKYAYTETSSITETTVKVDTYGETNASGALTFSGLSAGKYIITEVEAKDGYNLLAAPIEVVITETLDQTAKTCSYHYSKDSAEAVDSNTIEIANAKGSTLPTTGGIGTKLFYIIGGLLVAGSVVLLVTKKRMKTNED